MKKISIITIHCQTNFGSVFQAYALNRYLRNIGYTCEIIDYRPDYIVNNYGKGIKGVIRKGFAFIGGGDVRKKYDLFLEKNAVLSTRSYRTYEELVNEQFDSFLYIVGSDQLWNIGYECGRDDSYKLSFIQNGNKMSYATSINTDIMNEDDIDELKTKIKEFRSISLREESAAIFFDKKLNIHAQWVCDPVFLLDCEHYEKLCSDIPYSDYILIYLVDDVVMLRELLPIVKKRTGYKVIYACGLVPKCECDIHIKSPGPIEMLSLVKNARLIITGSFHATSFSHIFYKDFIVIPPNNSERIVSLLNLSGLEDRMMRAASQCENVDFNIDYSKVQTPINKFIQESKKWLENNIMIIEAIE